MTEISPLHRGMIDDMTIRNLSPATQRSYLHAVTKFSRYFGRSPDRLGLEDGARVSGASGIIGPIVAGLEPDSLCPAVFLRRLAWSCRDTGTHCLCPDTRQAADDPKRRRDRAVSGSGSEPEDPHRTDDSLCGRAACLGSVHLKVRDIDGERGIIRVEHGKGGKDRNVMLSAQLLAILRVYWRLARPEVWLFPGRGETRFCNRKRQSCGRFCRPSSVVALTSTKPCRRTMPSAWSTAQEGRVGGRDMLPAPSFARIIMRMVAVAFATSSRYAASRFVIRYRRGFLTCSGTLLLRATHEGSHDAIRQKPMALHARRSLIS